ncbi:zinc-dependent alcohol dehydrogenase family protein [Calycomorphotria hydatis]|uniref:Alcohol dehydrogenase n=1 Tax=Calycomorphotria hydatis TaxID=2528027 RepID=A0A517T603_9PLAN|nr:NAD(P)-dependent alcohol dehydrogenase [Calycomorphotria hydatis]QDT63807.1 Alcohol dehydrogenase [Calycomorphotria hydatis]
MRAYQIQDDSGIDGIKAVELPDPECGPGDVMIRVGACSLNYRDLIVTQGGYARNDTRPVIPLSDGAGEVIAVGEEVTEFAIGDRVTGCFFRDWQGGDVTDAAFNTARGGGIDGMLAEYHVGPAYSFVKTPSHLSDEEAATLPCAAVTAWQSLVDFGKVKPGHTVLTLGTGGVSCFAIQFAKLHGARVIATSSSNEKLEQAKQLGADETINYREDPDWEKTVRRLTDGVGVDHVVEVGGVGTLQKSLRAAALNGRIGLIGVLTGTDGAVNPLPAIFNRVTISGIYVGSREMFAAMNRAITMAELKPAIDRVFEFDQAVDAYRHLASAGHVGKVVIQL